MEKPLRHSTIQFEKNKVIKTADPALMRVEVEKNRKAFEIGKDCGLFRVPKVLEYYESKGIAVFEKIDGIEPFGNTVFSGRQSKSSIEQIGTSLAVIHQKLDLSRNMIVALPPELDSPENFCMVTTMVSIFVLGNH